ncbi:MAG: hypothetical protein DRN04_18980 [Thermoprotei archaeon]|nr:MAG: hypothetical protein DRN04_18980 [Thermoprotei archaeon]
MMHKFLSSIRDKTLILLEYWEALECNVSRRIYRSKLFYYAFLTLTISLISILILQLTYSYVAFSKVLVQLLLTSTFLLQWIFTISLATLITIIFVSLVLALKNIRKYEKQVILATINLHKEVLKRINIEEKSMHILGIIKERHGFT